MGPLSTRTRGAIEAARAWRWLGWFSLVLLLAGVVDVAFAWVPLGIGLAGWEFDTIATSISGLPLIATGFAGLLASSLARGIRWQIMSFGWLVLIAGLVVLASLVLFVRDAPVVLDSANSATQLEVKKAIVRSLFLGLLFCGAFLAAGVGALRVVYSDQT